MRKRSVIIFLVAAMMLGVTACGNETENEPATSVDVSVQESVGSTTAQETVETKGTEADSTENNSKESGQGDVACYKSQRPICEYTSDYPQGICTDFSYFIYGNNTDAPYIAQKYLEQIGVSEENTKLIVKLADDSDMPVSLTFLEYKFEGDTTMTREHYFFANSKSYEENVEYLSEAIDEKNDDAFYIRSKFRDCSPLYYNDIINLDGNGYYEIIW